MVDLLASQESIMCVFTGRILVRFVGISKNEIAYDNKIVNITDLSCNGKRQDYVYVKGQYRSTSWYVKIGFCCVWYG